MSSAPIGPMSPGSQPDEKRGKTPSKSVTAKDQPPPIPEQALGSVTRNAPQVQLSGQKTAEMFAKAGEDANQLQTEAQAALAALAATGLQQAHDSLFLRDLTGVYSSTAKIADAYAILRESYQLASQRSDEIADEKYQKLVSELQAGLNEVDASLQQHEAKLNQMSDEIREFLKQLPEQDLPSSSV